MQPRFLLALTLAPLLAACGAGAGGGKLASASTRPAPSAPSKARTPVRTPVAVKPMPIRAAAVAGLEGVIGATSADLLRQFGPARLDVWEGDARKLQFTGSPCVLDIYLYPPALGREPQASHVEARRASDGEEVDRIACVSALRKH
jgi:hypothetical protein